MDNGDFGTARRLAVVGQGYVGLPLAMAASDAGFEVTGFDKSERVVSMLNRAVSHVDDISRKEIERAIAGGYRASCDPASMSGADIFVICVPTPLAPDGGPDLSAVESAAMVVSQCMEFGCLVVLESTTYPGTTEEVVKPILERNGMRHGKDFLLAFSPERVDPGNPNFGIRNTPKLVGGVNPEASEHAAEFYAAFVTDVVVLSGAREAEMAKLLENTYRHVNIALVNEMARFCHDLKIDIWEAIRGAATKPFGFAPFSPGPGVGGHCIPIDPNYLSHEVRRRLGYSFRFVELAQEINGTMPRYVADRVAALLNNRRMAVNGARILLVGVTYKPDISDTRETPADGVADELRARGAWVSYHDPYVKAWRPDVTEVDDSLLLQAASESDLVVLLQAHAVVDLTLIATAAQSVLDCRGAMAGENIERL